MLPYMGIVLHNNSSTKCTSIGLNTSNINPMTPKVKPEWESPWKKQTPGAISSVDILPVLQQHSTEIEATLCWTLYKPHRKRDNPCPDVFEV